MCQRSNPASQQLNESDTPHLAKQIISLGASNHLAAKYIVVLSHVTQPKPATIYMQ